jgi:hypothetical protein
MIVCIYAVSLENRSLLTGRPYEKLLQEAKHNDIPIEDVSPPNLRCITRLWNKPIQRGGRIPEHKLL